MVSRLEVGAEGTSTKWIGLFLLCLFSLSLTRLCRLRVRDPFLGFLALAFVCHFCCCE